PTGYTQTPISLFTERLRGVQEGIMSSSAKTVTCVVRLLPRSEWLKAARNAIQVNPANQPPDLDDGQLQRGAEGDRLALDVTRYWGHNGVCLTVGFIDTPNLALRKHILLHLNAWARTANVSFVPSDVEPQVRIARWTVEDSPCDQGYWS